MDIRKLTPALILLFLLASCQHETVDMGAVVLVNSESPGFSEFESYIEPFLKNFGIPYTCIDIATDHVTVEALDCAVIVVGHRGLDVDGAHLDPEEHEALTTAVLNGTGLVNFDGDLADEVGAGRYPFVDNLFGFAYGEPATGSGVAFVPQGTGYIECWQDASQDPVLQTTTDSSALDATDGEWTEFHYISGGRPFPAVFAGADEEDHGLPVMRFYAGGVPDGAYEIVANLYTSGTGRDMRYYFGFTEESPKAFFVDTVGGEGGPDQHEEYSLGTVAVSGGTFEIFVSDADLLSGSYPFFGWAWIYLIPADAPETGAHYITARHEIGERLDTGEMTLSSVVGTGHATTLAMTGTRPFLAVTSRGEGRAVQWGSVDWMRSVIKGPVAGMDDLVWRSIVWAARKPFAMQCLPPLVTLRVDDVSGPFWWVEIANDYGLTPWLGVFLHDMSVEESNHLSSLANGGLATASVHAFTSSNFFYYDHGAARDRPDESMAASFEEASQWHADHDIPISSYVLPHYYEFGTNVFEGLAGWPVEFVGTMMEPGLPYSGGTPWLIAGPYRSYEAPGICRDGGPVYYADSFAVPDQPEFDGRFFVCATEIRDDAGYEWYPDGNVAGSIGRGVRQVTRALDSRVLATLFTHEQYIQPLGAQAWEEILAGVAAGLAELDPVYVSQDDGVRTVRALHTSRIEKCFHDLTTGSLSLIMSGRADIQTAVSVFTESGDTIPEIAIDVPAFEVSTYVEQPF